MASLFVVAIFSVYFLSVAVSYKNGDMEASLDL